MKNASGYPQLILRLALGIGFLLPVMDRLGILGPHGAAKVSWGDWSHFLDYAQTMMPFLPRSLASVSAAVATTLEAIFGICLILGFKTRMMAFGSGVLTLVFAVCMALFQGIKAPFDYPVLVFTGGGFLLSCVDSFKWSIDNLKK